MGKFTISSHVYASPRNDKTDKSSIFLSLGELGPGDNIGLVASKSSATAVRGQYYAIAAAIGKIGAFVGTYVFPLLLDNPNPIAAGQNPFFVASSLCIFASVITYFGLPHIGQVSLHMTLNNRWICILASVTDVFVRILSPSTIVNSVNIWEPMDMILLLLDNAPREYSMAIDPIDIW
jgi:hypothetical protein